MEQPLPTDWGSWASYSPDGTKLAFTRHPGVWSRKHYRGSYAVDLWLMDARATRSSPSLGDGDYKGNYLWPMYGHDGEIYFVADRLPDEKNVKFGGPEVMKSVNNIWKISENGGAARQVTHHTDGNLFFPSMSADGKTIVYEENFGLWKLDIATGKSTRDPHRHQVRREGQRRGAAHRSTARPRASASRPRPSARRSPCTARSSPSPPIAAKCSGSRETPWSEQEPRWSPNGKWIAFVSDRTGREEIWIADELGHDLKQLSDVDCDKGAMIWAPDSKSLLWAGSDHKLRRVELEGGKTDELASSDVGPIGTPQFSPDGKWISYSKEDNEPPLARLRQDSWRTAAKST